MVGILQCIVLLLVYLVRMGSGIKYMVLANRAKISFKCLRCGRKIITSLPREYALASHVGLSDKAPRTESGYRCHER